MLILIAMLATALSDKVDDLARKAAAHGSVAGVALYVEKRGEAPIVRVHGSADLELQAPLTPDSLFRIASITKQFTAASIMLLAEQGKLAIGDEITKFVPAAPVHGKKITLEHLLTHTSGIPNYTANPNLSKLRRQKFTPAEVVALVNDQPLDFEPGARMSYSNTNYILLGMVIEKVSGQSYGDFLEQKLFPRARLSRTYHCDGERILPGRVAGYTESKGKLVNADFIDMSVPYAAGSICSTVGDLAAWTSALEGGKVVSPASFARMVAPAHDAAGKPTGYGFGLASGDLEGHRFFGHDGGINGFESSQIRFPDDGVTAIVLANSELAGAHLLSENLARAALGLPEIQVRDLPVPGEELSRVAGRYRMGKREYVFFGKAGGLELRAAEDPEGESAHLEYQGNGDFFFSRAGFHVRFVPAGGKARAMQFGDGKERWGPEAPRVE